MNIISQQTKDQRIVNFLVLKKYRVWRHLLFLGVFYFFLFNSKYKQIPESNNENIWVLCVCLVFVPMFYINMYLLVPLFFKGKYIIYFILLVGVNFIGIDILARTFVWLEPTIVTDMHRKEDAELFKYFNAIFISTPFLMVSTMVKLFQKWVKDNEQIAELQKLTLNMELNELKNQISPHFLFNMLNNVKALIRANPEAATTVIMKLSEFLRYQLYENNEEKTPLSAEINFLSNFINLEKIRRDNLIVTLENNIDQHTLHTILIPPNLFTVFVENAVKHSVDISGKEAFINIEFKFEDKKLYFVCTNSKSENYFVPNEKYSGLGLANIKRRLELLYNNNYNLEITSTENKYIVSLTLPV
ncbi:sensor histidine kinase [Sphingobacterium siyangense]|uniref:GHKL domain-containing protein n=1 Tax=Sphingobacterium siyangense TaxID=459529 RepID=A0A562MG12_9SPHI|nr:histidine kinase [Sphingobacterium siyangense]TWI18812.1 GHKL domain-containing protein [Sphingobacterium siyangense]